MRRPDGAMDGSRFVGDYTNPILKPEAADIVKKRGEYSLTGNAFPDPWNQCQPEPTPYIWTAQLAFLMLQQPDQVTLIYFEDHKVRRVRMDASHPSHLTPTWQGDSIGRYENGTLVIDTVGIKVGPLSMVDRLGTPFSQSLHVIERFRLIDAETAREAVARGEKESARIAAENLEGVVIDADYKGPAVQVEITVEDQGMFTKPWSALVTYRRAVGKLLESVCAENLHEYNAKRETAVPQANKLDF
jgi:hypothetical protein